MRIAILGLGRMGMALARNLAEVGHTLMLYDRTPSKATGMLAPGAWGARTVAEAVANAQVVLTIVTGDEAEEALTFGDAGIIKHLPAGAIHLCMSTIGVATSRKLAQAHTDAGQGFVAAPVLGNPGSALSRHLWVLVAGPDTQVTRCMPIIEALGRGHSRVGTRPELAHALKLGANLLSVTMVEALAEALTFGEKAGLAPVDYLRILNLGLFRSPLMDGFGGMMVRQDHEPSDQTLDLAAKDLDLVLGAARDLGVDLPLAGPLRQRVEGAREKGFGPKDVTVLALAHRQGGEPRPKAERRKASVPREPDRRKTAAHEPRKPAPKPAPKPRPRESPRVEGSTFSAQGPEGTVMLDLERTSHFEESGGFVWAWVDGKRQATFWRSFPEVERALGGVIFVKVQRTILLNPQAVLGLKPQFAGRGKVTVAGDVELAVGREPMKRLKFLLGL